MCSKTVLYGSGTTIALKSSASVLICRIPVQAGTGQHFIKDWGAGHKAPPLPRELLTVSGYWKRGFISSVVEPLMSCLCLSQQILTSSQARNPNLSVSLIEDDKIGGGPAEGSSGRQRAMEENECGGT